MEIKQSHKRLARRALGLALAAALLVGMVVIGGVINTSAAVTPSTKLSMQVTDCPRYTFTAPETIWLAHPGSIGGSSSAFALFGSLADNNTLNPLITTGQVKFTGDADIQLQSFTAATPSRNVTNLTALTVGANSYTAGLSTSNGLSSALGQNQEDTITWTATFKLANDPASTTYTATAKTQVWCPSTEGGAIRVHAHNNGTYPHYVDAVAGVLGLHTNVNGTISGTGTSMRPLNGTWLYDLRTPANSYSSNYDTTYGGTTAYTSGNFFCYGDASYSTAGGATRTEYASGGTLYVDTSRYNSLNLLPNFYAQSLAWLDGDKALSGNKETWGGYYNGGWQKTIGAAGAGAASAIVWNLGVSDISATTAGTKDIGVRGWAERGVSGTLYRMTVEAWYSFNLVNFNKSTERAQANKAETMPRVPAGLSDPLSGINTETLERDVNEALLRLGSPKTAPGSFVAPATSMPQKVYTAYVNCYLYENGVMTTMRLPAAAVDTNSMTWTAADTKTYSFGDSIKVVAPKFADYELKLISKPGGIAYPTAGGTYTEDLYYNKNNAVKWDFYYERVKEYNVKYNGNDPNGAALPDITGAPPSDQLNMTKDTGNLVRPATDNTMALANYKFEGWNTQADGKGIFFPAGTSIATIIKDYPASLWAPWTGTDSQIGTMTLYAVWSENDKFRVEYYPNGPAAATPAIDYVLSAADFYASGMVPAFANPYTIPGYAFVEWNTKANGTGTSYLASETFAFPAAQTANLKLYAQWTPIKYTLHYDGNGHTGGTLPATDPEVEYGITTVLDAPVITKTGYKFDHWEVSNSDNGPATLAGDGNPGNTMRNTPGTVTLKAVWTPDYFNYKIWLHLAKEDGTYDADPAISGAEIDVINKSDKLTGELATVNLTEINTNPAYALYTFDSSQANELNGIVTTGGLVLKVYYKRALVKLTVDLADCTGAPSGIIGSFPWGSKYELTATNIPTKSGYEFDGWKIASPVPAGAAALDTNVALGKADITLGETDTVVEPKWKPGSANYYIDIYLADENGAYDLLTPSDTITKTDKKTDDTITLGDDGSEWSGTPKATAEKDYYNYVPYPKSDKEGEVESDGTLRLKLFFVRKECHLYVDQDGGTGGSDGDQGLCTWGTVVPLTEPTKPGYVFNGWIPDLTHPVAEDIGFQGNNITVGKGVDTYVIADWLPAGSTPYKINIYLQNGDETYGIVPPPLTRAGTTGEVIKLDGTEWPYLNTVLYEYDQDTTEAGNWIGTVAASPTLELKLYFKRIRRSLKAELDGGTGASDGLILNAPDNKFPWGAVVTLTAPTKDGYAFAGWQVMAGGTGAAANTGGDINKVTVGQQDTVVKALWTPDTVAYDVQTWKENASGAYVLTGTDTISTGNTGETAVAVIASDSFYIYDAAHTGNKLNGTIPAPPAKLVLAVYYKRTLVNLTVNPNGGIGGGFVGSYPWESTTPADILDTWKPIPPAGKVFGEWEIASPAPSGGIPAVVGGTVTLGKTDTVVRPKWLDGTAAYNVELYTENADGTYSLSKTVPETGATGVAPTINKTAYYNTYLTASYQNVSHGDDDPASAIAANGSTTFKLYFPRILVPLTVDFNYGTITGGIPAAGSYRWGQEVPIADPTRDNYAFAGWEVVTGAGAGIIGNNLIMGTGATNIKAKWILPASSVAQYKVYVYLEKAGGGYDASPSTSFIKMGAIGTGVSTPTDGSEWSDINYTFDGGAGNVFSGNLTSTVAGGFNTTSPQLELYYKRNTVSLTVDLGNAAAVPGGIAGGTTAGHLWGKEIGLGANPTLSGYTFSYWSVDDGLGSAIIGGTLTLGTQNTKITAHWTPIADVLYDVDIYLMKADGTYDLMTPSLTVKNAAQPGPGKAVAASGDWFGVGYDYDGSAGNVLIADLNTDGTTSARLKLYYSRVIVGVNVDIVGGVGSIAVPLNPVWGQVVYLTPHPTKDGYTFSGWALTGGSGYLDGDKLTLGENTQVRAIWIPRTDIVNYTVQIFLQKADGDYAAVADTTVTKTGPIGAGGATAAAGDWPGAGTSYVFDAAQVKNLLSATLNADGTTDPQLALYYKRTLVNLTVNPNGGAGGTASQAGLRWGQELPLTNPALNGYTFSHWRVTAGAGAGITVDGKLILGTSDTAIEAVWTENGSPAPDHSGCKLFGKCKVTGGCAMFGCKMPGWLSPFLHVGSFLLGFGAGWVTRAATMPWWLIVLLCILGVVLFPLFWWIIL